MFNRTLWCFVSILNRCPSSYANILVAVFINPNCVSMEKLMSRQCFWMLAKGREINISTLWWLLCDCFIWQSMPFMLLRCLTVFIKDYMIIYYFLLMKSVGNCYWRWLRKVNDFDVIIYFWHWLSTLWTVIVVNSSLLIT